MSALSNDGARPSGVRARLGALLLFALMILLLNGGVTQWLAFQLRYHPALGDRFAGLYGPFAWIEWQRWYDNAATSFNTAYLVVLLGSLLALAITIVAAGIATRSARAHASLHGTAHWATRDEIVKSGLLPASGATGAGVYVGGWEDPRTGDLHYLRHDGPEHVAGIAPSRSGKGVALVVPTLLSWEHSVFVNDRKGELWNLTAGWRARDAGNICLKFNPSSPTFDDCVSFNPLEEIRLGTESEVGDTQNVTTMLVDPDGKGLNDHWSKTAFAFLNGVVLHELYKARTENRSASLYDVLYAITDPARDIGEYYEEMMSNRHDEAGIYDNGSIHPVVAAEGRSMANKPDDERGSVLSTAVSYLSLYRDPIVRRHTSRSDFRIMDLMNADTPVSLYLVGRDEDKDRMRPLMRLVLNQIFRVLLRPELKFVDGRPLAPHKHRLLAMLDEFPSFGKLEVVQESLAFIAGYGIKAYLIMQDMAQLWTAYGRDETITSNCHVRAAFAPNRIETAEWLSKMTGTKTELKWQVTESGKRFGLLADGFSRSAQETSRPLMTPDEAMRLRAPIKEGPNIVAAGDMLIFAAGHAPVLGTQSLYFRDPVFLDRSRIPPPPSGRIPARTGRAVIDGATGAVDDTATRLKQHLWPADSDA